MTIKLNRSLVDAQLIQAAEAMAPQAVKHLGAVRDGSCTGGEWCGWFDYPRKHGFDLADSIAEFNAEQAGFYDTVVVCGIGGSYLGTRAVHEVFSSPYLLSSALEPMSSRVLPIVYAGHNLSEAGLIELLEYLDGREPMINVISKSGTTTEPSVAFRVLREYMERRYPTESGARIVATTDPKKGALRELADAKGYRTFEVPEDIGGRFSVLSAVGLVPLALAGVNPKDLLQGADSLFEELRGDLQQLQEHPVIQYAGLRHAAFAAGKRIEVLSYGEPKLNQFTEWWKQLFGESEGKDGNGLWPAALQCTTDLHSLGQYLQDGPRNILETFVTFESNTGNGDTSIERRLRVPVSKDDQDGLGYLEGTYIDQINQAAMQGTALAHCDGGVPVLRLSVPDLSLHSLGAMIAFYETTCAVSGLMLGVNPFDQPGVEAYKKNLFGLLGKPGFEELGKQIKDRL